MFIDADRAAMHVIAGIAALSGPTGPATLGDYIDGLDDDQVRVTAAMACMMLHSSIVEQGMDASEWAIVATRVRHRLDGPDE